MHLPLAFYVIDSEFHHQDYFAIQSTDYPEVRASMMSTRTEQSLWNSEQTYCNGYINYQGACRLRNDLFVGLSSGTFAVIGIRPLGQSFNGHIVGPTFKSVKNDFHTWL